MQDLDDRTCVSDPLIELLSYCWDSTTRSIGSASYAIDEKMAKLMPMSGPAYDALRNRDLSRKQRW
jgi:hypothetical protein